MKRKDFWPIGAKTELSQRTRIARQEISRILHRKAGISKYVAMRFELAAKEMGLDIPMSAWLFNKVSLHPAFYGKPDKNEKELIKKLARPNKI